MKETIYAKAFRIGQQADSPEPLDSREWCELAYPLEDHARKMIERSFRKGYTTSQAAYASALATETRERAQALERAGKNRLMFVAPENMVVQVFDSLGVLYNSHLSKGDTLCFDFNGNDTATVTVF